MVFTLNQGNIYAGLVYVFRSTWIKLGLDESSYLTPSSREHPGTNVINVMNHSIANLTSPFILTKS